MRMLIATDLLSVATIVFVLVVQWIPFELWLSELSDSFSVRFFV
jgi:hypothetical protein